MRCARVWLQASVEQLNSPFHRMKGHKKLQNNEVFEQTEDELRGLLSGKAVKKALRELGITKTVGQEVAIPTRPHLEQEEAYEPPLKRKWLSGPLSQLSTAYTRKDWFRVMQANMLVDHWTPQPLDALAREQLRIKDKSVDKFFTTPVAEVRPFIPKFAREGALDSDPEFVPYDAALDGPDPPPFLTPAFRAKHMENEVRYYKPDLICLNEVQRGFANNNLWKALRPMGYGMFYTTSRGHSVVGDSRGQLLRSRTRRVPLAEDIGNVVFFYKGRFVPFYNDDLVPLHTFNMTWMRDKITQMCVLLACVQLSAGATAEAVAHRAHEAKQILNYIDLAYRDDVERFHATTLICGDLNNVTDDEPCVEIFRSRFFSAYDIAGGPRWTAWYHEGSTEMNSYADFALNRVEDETFTQSGLIKPSQLHAHCKPPIPGTRPSNVFKPEQPKPRRIRTTEPGNASEKKTSLSAEEISELERAIPDKLQLRAEIQKRQGVAQRTQDFIFHNPERLALIQLLDTPDEAQIDPIQLLPSRINPSHHVPLMIDVSFNETDPLLGDIAMRNSKAK
jgi:hypothetical protein